MERPGAQKSSNPLKKLPRHKRHRIASQVKTGKTFSTNERATVAELQDQILFYLNEYMVHKTEGRILHRRFCKDFEGWTRPIWSKVSTPLRTKLRNELENRGVVFNNKFKEISDKLTNLIELGYQTSGETDYGSIISSYESDNSESNIGKGKQPIYNKSGLEPRTPTTNPKAACTVSDAYSGTGPEACARTNPEDPDPSVQQEHLGFHRQPFANIPFHIREEQLTQEEDGPASMYTQRDLESHFSHQDPRNAAKYGYGMEYDTRRPRPQFRHAHHQGYEDPRQFRHDYYQGYDDQRPYTNYLPRSRHGQWQQQYFHTGPKAYYTQVPQPEAHQNQEKEVDEKKLERNIDRMIRAYTTNEDKSTGEEDDFFRPKLLKFKENCTRWEIPEDTMPKVFPLMLTGKAAEYYTGIISPNRPGINDMIAQIQAHFETRGQLCTNSLKANGTSSPRQKLGTEFLAARREARKIIRRTIPPVPAGYEIKKQIAKKPWQRAE
ncbi:hypothetical protein E4U31_003498 [Claviceps sp. LM219 group G6]|nr:hypothetical protein E4U31_003498 [Claviceps sp. LM219 group G6]